MNDSPIGPLAQVTIGDRAARTLVADLARRSSPTAGLVIEADPGSAVLAAAIEALLPDDVLTVVATDPSAMRAHLSGLGSWVEQRVRVVESLAGAEPAEVVVLGRPIVGTAEQARATLDGLAKLVAPGGVVCAATIAVPGVAPGASTELARQDQLFGTGSDLVLRNLPPVRVHRLRWTAAEPAAAEQLTPMPRPSSVRLTRELHIDSNGVAAAGIMLGVAALTRFSRQPRLWLLPAAAALPVAAFFRDPHREVPEDGSLVVAASDGRVLSVERVRDPRFGDDAEYLRIAVFLSVLDVHINRAPVAGRVVDYFLTDGGYAAAMTAAGEHNVAAYTVLETVRGRVVVAQRTGLLARRIVQRAPVGSLLARGERFGLIRFGSRTDVYLPAGAAEPLIAPGDRVRGGATPIARWR